MHDASPGASVGSSSSSPDMAIGVAVVLSFWSQEDTGCWREKKTPLFGCMQVGWRWNTFSFLQRKLCVPS